MAAQPLLWVKVCGDDTVTLLCKGAFPLWTPRMSELEKAVVALIDVFHRYSGKEGDKHKLKKSELKELINNELSHFLEEIKEQEVVDKVMETLDNDGDGECDFQEFMAFVAMVTTACHEFFEHE